jgi:hypothetical protein
MSSLKKASVPVFNYGGSTFIGREHELGNGTGEENGSGSGSELGGVGERDSLLDLQRQMLTTLPDLSWEILLMRGNHFSQPIQFIQVIPAFGVMPTGRDGVRNEK